MTEPDYFDSLYSDKDDPWDLSSSPYERRKRELLLASLPRLRYRKAFEPGCAVGVTTAALALRSDHLLAMDGAASAVSQTRERVAGMAPHVDVVRGRVPDDWPNDHFDLIVVSELLYYLDGAARSRVADQICRTAARGGDVVAVHWRHPFTEAATSGDEAQEELTTRLSDQGFGLLVHHVEPDFGLHVYRAPARPRMGRPDPERVRPPSPVSQGPPG